MTHAHETVHGAGAARRVEVRREIPAPIEDIWEALVNAEAVSQWFSDASLDPREGGRLELRFGKTVVTGTIKTLIPPNVFAYTWEQEGESTSLVQFDLIALSEARTLVTVVQTALDEPVAGEVVAGWVTMLGRLSELVTAGAS